MRDEKLLTIGESAPYYLIAPENSDYYDFIILAIFPHSASPFHDICSRSGPQPPGRRNRLLQSTQSMTDPSESILQARAILDSAEIPSADRSAFLASLTAALAGGDPSLTISPSQRQPWARALLAVANVLLQLPAESPPPDAKDETEEEEEFLLTPSEFELWEKTKPRSAAAAPIAVPDAATEDSAPLEERSESDSKPAAKPSATDEFEDFVIDKVEVVD
jgi:hypothetical protein